MMNVKRKQHHLPVQLPKILLASFHSLNMAVVYHTAQPCLCSCTTEFPNTNNCATQPSFIYLHHTKNHENNVLLGNIVHTSCCEHSFLSTWSLERWEVQDSELIPYQNEIRPSWLSQQSAKCLSSPYNIGLVVIVCILSLGTKNNQGHFSQVHAITLYPVPC